MVAQQQRTATTAPSGTTDSLPLKHIVIVGAGMAGLTCARELLRGATPSCRVTLLEADECVGGRIQADASFVPGHVFDTGAEFIHGTDTALAALIDELRASGIWEDQLKDGDQFLEEIFITSHADGGPDEQPTSTGKYGMYYVNGKLLKYDDPSLQELHTALEEILDDSEHAGNPTLSLQDALIRRQPPLSPELYAMAVASYGNTAACHLNNLCLSRIMEFEKHWHENETEGDYRLPSQIGMYGVVQGLLSLLQSSPHFELVLNCVVDKIAQDVNSATVVSEAGRQWQADCVVVSVPPPAVRRLQVDLSPAKLQALEYIGFERVTKVCCKFSVRHWSVDLQSLVCSASCADTGQQMPIPEMWFREFEMDNGATEYVAVGYLGAEAADAFAAATTGSDDQSSLEQSTDILLRQLGTMLDVSIQHLTASLLGSLQCDWKRDRPFVQGGYVYPKTGCTATIHQALSDPDGRIFWAGEATNAGACCTVQAAMETGVRAANQIQEVFWWVNAK